MARFIHFAILNLNRPESLERVANNEREAMKEVWKEYATFP